MGAVLLGISIMLLHLEGQDAVQFEIKINPESEYQLFNIGEGRALICTVSETPDGKKPDLSWEIGDVRVTDTDTNSRVTIEPTSSGLMLRIADVVDGDGGTYKCTGTLGGQEDSRSIRVEVFKPLTINSPQKQWGILDQDGTVSCDATGKPSPTITWKFINRTNIPNSDKYVISPNKLTIKKLEIDDAKSYLCDIVVVQTGARRSFIIDYEVVQLPVIRLLPTIKPNNPKVGDKVEIRCEAEGRPKPTYSFYGGENLIPEDKVDEQNGILTLLDVKREDEATYTCQAKNIGGEDSKSNTLDVLIPPVIENIADINAVEGGEVRLTCIAEGDPQPSVTWKKDGAQQSYVDTGKRENDPEIIPENFDNNINAEIKKAGRTILFKPVRPEDAGTYTCTSMNIVGNSSRNVKFEVKYKPNFNNFQQTVFMGWPGHRANLTCMASANELASITWYEPDSKSPDDKSLARRIEKKAPFTITTLVTWPDYHLSSSSLLVEVTPNDNSLYKNYLCEATNTFDSAWRTVTLKEAVVPGQPVVRRVSSFSSMVTLEFEKPDKDGGVPVTGYKYTWYLSDQAASFKEQEADITGDTTTVELRGLQAGSNYVVKVQARNPVGLSSANSIQFTTANYRKPLKLSIVSPSEGTDDTSYTIQWADPDNGGSPILKYNIKYRQAEVIGTDAKSWKVRKYVDNYKVATVNGANARHYTITPLMRDSYYEIRITAVNDKGESAEEFKIIKTSKGDSKHTFKLPLHPSKRMKPKRNRRPQLRH
ncbi:unnamed protein product [Lymnaea stagnalis]|uniref:Uncharacterized protein n=1 Tax=Lymnaea stagnalis TaxID=6523 RepID=A0AAV2ICP6_LYMST